MNQVEKIVYFVRHGQSEANASRQFQAPDSPLTKLGLKQAERIAQRISQLEFDTLITSPYPRARDTAKAISKITGKVPEFSDLFVERVKPTSLLELTPDNEEALKVYEMWKKTLFDDSSEKVEDGENFSEIVNRADKALNYLHKHPGKNLVVVTHGFFLRTIIARVLLDASLTPDNHRKFQNRATMENTGLSAIRYEHNSIEEDSRWNLWIHNDHAHLA